jgi:hypothetical protein
MNSTASPVAENLFYPAPPDDSCLIGLPRLMEMAFRGIDLRDQATALLQRAQAQPDDANALMDLSCVLHLHWNTALALRTQVEALSLTRAFQLPAQGTASLRVLALMAQGELMSNVPLEFLLHGSDVALTLLYLAPGEGLPAELPPHDIVFNAVCESDRTASLLRTLSLTLKGHGQPAVNDASRILAMARESAWRLVQGLAGCVMPPSARVARQALADVAGGRCPVDQLLPDLALPFICRPAGSHAGLGLERIDSLGALDSYLGRTGQDDFIVSPYVDYRSADGLFRKYRIAFIGGRPYPVHMAVSARWMVHYLNADMLDQPAHRAEEARFFADFDTGFAARHGVALAGIDERIGLDYHSIDCAETADGRLLVFEADSGGVAHAMDPIDPFGYKRPHMVRLFAAFRDLLLRASREPGALKVPPLRWRAPMQ